MLLGCCGMWFLLKGRSLKKGPPGDEGEVGAPYEVPVTTFSITDNKAYGEVFSVADNLAYGQVVTQQET